MDSSGFSPETVAVASGVLTVLFLTNIGAIIGVYVSMRVQIAVLKVKADTLARDVNALGKNVRALSTTKRRRN